MRFFELYLLSRMRAQDRVSIALTALGASRTDMGASRAQAVRMGFEEAVHSADLYKEVLGAPRSTHPDQSPNLTGAFAGSVLHRFRLTIWPDFDFGVREAPSGFSWGMGFFRPVGTKLPVLASVADLVAWAVLEADATARFAGRQMEDAWSGWENVSYLIPPSVGEPNVRYLLGFDWNILQTIRVMEGECDVRRAASVHIAAAGGSERL
jgi:hypothetical protein